MTKRRFKKNNSHYSKTIPKKAFNLKYFNIMLVVLLAGLGIFYLVLINDLTIDGFTLEHLNAQSNNLATINLNDQEAINSAQSSANFNSRIASLGLVAVNDVQYLSAPSSLVAVR